MSFEEIPDEVILGSLLPVLPLGDLMALSATSKRYYFLANDEMFWLHKTIDTFHLSPASFAPPTARSGWSKKTFQGLSKPRTFVWGNGDNGRLGYPRARGPEPMIYIGAFPIPREISSQFEKDDSGGGQGTQDSLAQLTAMESRALHPRKSPGIVELQAGGWSFAARDLHGGVWAWGQLDGMYRIGPRNWSSSCYTLHEPTRLPLPCYAAQISLGRQHLLVLDQDNILWEMQAYGRAYRHTSPLLTSPNAKGSKSYPHHIVQISASWSHSACLTSEGEIHYWFPMSDLYKESLQLDQQPPNTTPVSPASEDQAPQSVECGKVGAGCVVALEPIPNNDAYDPGQGYEKSRKVVKIASGQDFLISLLENGEVWFRALHESGAGDWQFLPAFSGPSVTHVSAQFLTLTTYSPETARVMLARVPEERLPGFFESLQPEPLPGLQGKTVIQVAIGDYHYAALTNKGEMYTWGKNDHGELGLGHGIGDIEEPTRVRFPLGPNLSADDPAASQEQDEEEEAFVFSITAAGWHTGALLLGDPRKPTVQALGRLQNPTLPGQAPSNRSSAGAPAADLSETRFGLPMFRVGFPGRIGFGARGARGGVGASPPSRLWQPRGTNPEAD